MITQTSQQLNDAHGSSPLRTLRPGEKIVVFSDLHLGDGGRNDDFLKNGPFFHKLLRQHYAPHGWTLVLNGDIEELLRHKETAIHGFWKDLYNLFSWFHRKERFFKIEGNHDPKSDQGDRFQILPGLRVSVPGGELFFCHGHQGGLLNSGKHNKWVGILLKIFANPLGLKNLAPSWLSKSRYVVEERVYRWAKEKGLVLIMGHTHRPLFESRPKSTNLERRLDSLCRKWSKASRQKRIALEDRINFTLADLKKHREEGIVDLPTQIYQKELLLPCLFNSGCGIGKRGITALEISRKKIRLVHWSDPDIHPPSPIHWEEEDTKIYRTGLRRTILRSESLAYIFSRITLLQDPSNR